MVITEPGKYVTKNGGIETVTSVWGEVAYGDAFTTNFKWDRESGRVIGAPFQFDIVLKAD